MYEIETFDDKGSAKLITALAVAGAALVAAGVIVAVTRPDIRENVISRVRKS